MILVLIQMIIVITIMIVVNHFYKFTKPEITYQKSAYDHKEYLVLNLDDKEEASYVMSLIYHYIFRIRDHLQKNIEKYTEFKPYIIQFCNRISNLNLIENPPIGKYTSYTLNKGEEISLCIRSKKTGKIHDINLIMYVVLHELSHVACPEKNHTPLFKKIFVFLLQVAIEMGIYKNVNYQLHPTEYCGLTINEHLLNN
jgi:hypothetical protein